MTTELEQEFFKVFGIEPIPIKNYGFWLIKGSIAENDKGEKVVYPEITDRILLDLICLHNSSCRYAEDLYTPCELENVKEEFLEEIINIQKHPDEVYYYEGSEDFKHQIQSLFREGKK